MIRKKPSVFFKTLGHIQVKVIIQSKRRQVITVKIVSAIETKRKMKMKIRGIRGPSDGDSLVPTDRNVAIGSVLILTHLVASLQLTVGSNLTVGSIIRTVCVDMVPNVHGKIVGFHTAIPICTTNEVGLEIFCYNSKYRLEKTIFLKLKCEY